MLAIALTWAPGLVAAMPLLVGRNTARPRSLSILQWLIIILYFVITWSSAFALSDSAMSVVPSAQPPTWALITAFFASGAFLVFFFGLIVTTLVLELLNVRRKMYSLSRALWTPSFILFLFI